MYAIRSYYEGQGDLWSPFSKGEIPVITSYSIHYTKLYDVLTKKGKGYPPAEANPALFHGVGPFDRSTGEVISDKSGAKSYTAVFGSFLTELAHEDPRIVAITAAMLEGTSYNFV